MSWCLSLQGAEPTGRRQGCLSKRNPMMLSPEEVSRYQDKGYVVPRYQLPAELVAIMREEYDRLIHDNPDISPDFILGPHLQKPGTQGVKGSKKWLEFATHPDLMAMARDLIGDDIILWGTTIFGKPAHNGKETPWHQDGDYYPIRPLETMTIWIALDDVSIDNGPMRFIPGSHKQHKLYSHHWEENPDLTINLACDDKHFDSSTSENLILKAGQVSYHDVYMIHGSLANKTSQRRAGFVVRLMPASSHYDHALGLEMGKKHEAHDYGKRPLYLVSGKDAHGGNDFTIGH